MTFFRRRTGQLRAWARRTLWCIVVIGTLCAIVIPIFSIYRKEGENARSVVEVGPQGVSHTGDYIHVVGSVASVDFEDKNFRVHFEFTPHGTLAGDDGVLSSTIAISLFYTTLTFPEAQIMRSVDVTMPYMQGATIDYPFDTYKSYFEILAHKEKEQLHKIPVSLTFLGMLQSVEFIPIVRVSEDDLYKVSIEILTKRSPTTIGFSLFIVLIMWALSITIGIIAIQVIQKYRVTDEHVLTLGITTLFALPALRETQPGIPSIGCAADVLGFYWNMAIIAISSIMILMASALRWKEPSIEREIELIHKQHDFQSKLISEMSIPMPLPITGGPFHDYRIRKKRVPFVVNKRIRKEHGPTELSSLPLVPDSHLQYHVGQDGIRHKNGLDHPNYLPQQQQHLYQLNSLDMKGHGDWKRAVDLASNHGPGSSYSTTSRDSSKPPRAPHAKNHSEAEPHSLSKENLDSRGPTTLEPSGQSPIMSPYSEAWGFRGTRAPSGRHDYRDSMDD
ncbi:hypothetical protein BGX31_001625 [Mortierella sp. GBA43]|nr:hypothetical protein BGX31_001625 [Mortierella sp. GBA43]